MTSPSDIEEISGEEVFDRLWSELGDNSNPVNEIGTERKPDFLCIGTEKAGTTWLWSCLNAHPHVGVPATKELRFFNEGRNFDYRHFRALREFLEDPRAAPLRAAFLERVATEIRLLYGGLPAYYRIFGQLHQPIVGELTPQYCLQPPERVQKMYEVAPDARIIYMLRDPVERLVSGARMALRAAEEPLRDDLILREANNHIQIALSNAHIHLEKFERVFGEDKVRVYFYDDIATRPQELLTEICDFLGAERARFDPEVLGAVVNPGVPYKPAPEVYQTLYCRLIHVFSSLENRFPAQVELWRQKYE